MKNVFRVILFAVAIIILFIVTVYLTFYVATKPYVYSIVSEVPQATVALVPGAALTIDGKLSTVFKARVDGAILLYKAKKVTKILVSGDNGTLEHNEVNPARVYLIAEGVLDQDIFLDHAGFDTYSSMYRARTIFGVTNMIVTTQSFHEPRAVFIARALGIETFGLSTDIKNLSPENYLREIFANEKAIFDLTINRVPKFLGEAIPLSDNGKKYP